MRQQRSPASKRLVLSAAVISAFLGGGIAFAQAPETDSGVTQSDTSTKGDSQLPPEQPDFGPSAIEEPAPESGGPESAGPESTSPADSDAEAAEAEASQVPGGEPESGMPVVEAPPDEELYGTSPSAEAGGLSVPDGAVPLQLEVKINARSTNLIAAFFQFEDGRFATTRAELTELGIAAPGDGKPEDIILLDDVPTLAYAYNEDDQSIDIRIDASARVMQDIDAAKRDDILLADSGTGMLVNYSLFSALNADYGFEDTNFNGISSQVDARLFSKLGTLDVSGIIATPDFEVANTTRLDTTYAYDDVKRMMQYQIGDVISGSMNWTRPVRLGGGQARRNFGLRPDLITQPLPFVDGSAGVPSTLDVYIDGVRAYSQQLDEGPFRVNNVPVFTNEGTARVVLTDASGREVEAEGEFFTAPNLLRQGLYDFSLEGGFLRQRYGEASFDYADYPVAVANLRYGLSDYATLEVHAEGSEELQNGGLGILAAIPRFGTLNAAVAASNYNGGTGLLFYASWEKRWGRMRLGLSSGRTLGDYEDLESVNAFELTGKKDSGVPKAVDQISFGYALPDYDASIGASLVHSLNAAGERDLILSGSFSKSFGDIDVSGGGYSNFGDNKDYGVTLGLSMPFGKKKDYMVAAGVIKTKDNYEVSTDLAKSHNDSEYSRAWRMSAAQTDDHRYLDGRIEQRTPVGVANGTMRLHETGGGGTMAFDGALVATRSGVLLGRRVGDSFAIVDTGAAGVTVKHENRYAGKTNRNGQLLVPSVVPYTKNKFDLDLDSLPITAQMPESEKFVVPRARAGVIVDFKVTGSDRAAIVKIKDTSGEFVPVSTEIELQGIDEPFLMGYDGEVYLTGLADKNSLTVKLPTGDCRVEFDYAGDAQNQEFVGPLTCA